jgi:hypothetical protein
MGFRARRVLASLCLTAVLNGIAASAAAEDLTALLARRAVSER